MYRDILTLVTIWRGLLRRISQGVQLVMVESSLEIGQLLLNSGAEVSVTDNEAWTSIHAAARSGYREIVELLLDLAQISKFEIRNKIHRCIAFLQRKQQLNQTLQQALQDLGGAAVRYHNRDQACGEMHSRASYIPTDNR